MLLVVMGVCGCGKTTIGQVLASKLDYIFKDADEFHSVENKTKMNQSIPLTDEDRVPWLVSIHHFLRGLHEKRKSGIVTCSALKTMYRDILRSGGSTCGNSELHLPLWFIYLKGDKHILQERMDARTGHFMPSTLLDSQLDTLEELGPLEASITVDINNTVDTIANEILNQLEIDK